MCPIFLKTHQFRNADLNDKFEAEPRGNKASIHKNCNQILFFHRFDLRPIIDRSFQRYLRSFHVKKEKPLSRARCGLLIPTRQMQAKNDGWQPRSGLKLMEWFLLPRGTEEVERKYKQHGFLAAELHKIF